MERWLLFLTVVCLAFSHQAQAQAQAVADPDSTQEFPSRVQYRSRVESIAALPGRIVYFPIGLTGYAARQGFTLLYEKRVIRRLRDYLTFMDGRTGVRLLSSSRVGSGGRVFFNDLLWGGNIEFTTTVGASAAQRRQHLFSLDWPKGLTFDAQFLRDPKYFNGIGPDSREEDNSSFSREDLSLQLTHRRSLKKDFKLDMQVQYHLTEIGPGPNTPSLTASPLVANQLPGLEARTHMLKTAIVLRSSSVDVPGNPTQGNRTRLQLGYSQSFDEQLSHLNFALISEQFFELFHRRILSLRAGTDWRYAPGNHQVPFYDLAMLGGFESLRGYRAGRFRDQGVVFATTTYHFPIWKIAGGTLFYEVGRTLHVPGDVSLDYWQDTQGGSLLLWMPKALIGELILARSSEQRRMLFNFKTDF